MKEEIIRLLNKLSDRDLRGILYVLQTLTKEEVQHEKAAFKKAETAAWEKLPHRTTQPLMKTKTV